MNADACPTCGEQGLALQDAGALISASAKRQIRAELSGRRLEWLVSFGFGCFCLFAGLFFIWNARMDPVNAGVVDPVSATLCYGAIVIGLWLFILSARDWRSARTAPLDPAVMMDSRFCPGCRLAWNKKRQVRVDD